MSIAEAGGRLGRSYTRARRMPWVQGKLGDWRLPFGPYTPAQIGVACAGAWLLIKTFSVWRSLGVVPPVLLIAAVWAVRHAKIGGRSLLNCVLGLASRLMQPRGGRIGGRPVRESRSRVLYGGVVIEDGVAFAAAGGRAAAGGGARAGRERAAVAGRRWLPRRGRRVAAVAAPRVRPAPTQVQRMLRQGLGEEMRGAGEVRS
ncbi:hypothetical protein ACIBK8_28570 [Streptomyces sp. NPDC050161]|uniref:hypothetical protein n=1 Tax=Streptomyces sp. NPDC050161 TaxID=3365604 RepID=UPI0037A3D78D